MLLARRCAVGLAAAVGVAAFWAPAAGAITSGAVLDQASTGSGVYYHAFNNSGLTLAQVFTAGATGSLTDVEVNMRLYSGPADDVEVSIWGTSGGAPNSSAVLATATIPAASIGSSESLIGAAFASPASIRAGTKYAIALSGASGGGSTTFWSHDAASYNGGQSYFGTSGNGYSIIFKTYVRPPAPGRAGYCSVAGNTWADGTPIAPGTFLDLVGGQPASDGRYAGATPAIYVKGYGTMCRLSDLVTYGGDPSTFGDAGYRVDDSGNPTPEHISPDDWGALYEYYVPTG